MRYAGRWLGVGVVLLGIVAVILFLRLAAAAGTFKAMVEWQGAACRVIEAVPGPEDIVIDRERGFAFVAATDRRLTTSGSPEAANVRGGIYLIDLNRPVEQWALASVTPAQPSSFRPHGLGLYVSETGARSLFVVSHPAGRSDEVVIFDVDEQGQLNHRRTVSDPLLTDLNDVQPVGADAFYATNDHGDGMGTLLQDFLMLDQANLVYFDGEVARIAADGLTYANGVNVSADGREVYVAETLDGVVRIYDRDLDSGSLTLVDYAAIGTGVDNIDVLENGELLVGAHPKMFDFMRHAEDPEALSPSQVISIQLKEDGGGRVRTLYLDNGEELSGVAVAAGYGDIMLLGPVFQPRVLACKRSDLADVE